MAKGLLCIDNEGKLQPGDEEGVKIIKRLAPGELFIGYRKANRNLIFHRKYFAVLRELFHMQEHITNEEAFRAYMLIAVGHCEFITSPKNGELMAIPKSISFDNLPDDDDFSEIYNKTVPAFMDRFGVELNQAAIDYLATLGA